MLDTDSISLRKVLETLLLFFLCVCGQNIGNAKQTNIHVVFAQRIMEIQSLGTCCNKYDDGYRGCLKLILYKSNSDPLFTLTLKEGIFQRLGI